MTTNYLPERDLDFWRERALLAKGLLAEIERLRVADYGFELAEQVREINNEIWE